MTAPIFTTAQTIGLVLVCWSAATAIVLRRDIPTWLGGAR